VNLTEHVERSVLNCNYIDLLFSDRSRTPEILNPKIQVDAVDANPTMHHYKAAVSKHNTLGASGFPNDLESTENVLPENDFTCTK
jgi:hypothetical protein